MNVILKSTNDLFEKDLILAGDNPKVVGEITKRTDANASRRYTQVLLGVNWLVDPETLVPNVVEDTTDNEPDDHANDPYYRPSDSDFSEANGYLRMTVYDLALHGLDYSSYVSYHATDKGIFTTVNHTDPKSIIQSAVDDQRALFAVAESEYDIMDQYMRAGRQLSILYKDYPIYKNIIQTKNGETQLISLLDLIFTLDDTNRDDFILAISYAGGYVKTLKSIAERVLKLAKPEEGLSLMTQEQQVEGFIQFSKLVANQTEELVTDETLDAMRESDVYKRVVSDLTENGFGLSETQQFNALQAAAYLNASKSSQSVMYNLSDMGAGKTLMTVESIFLMDLKTIYDFNAQADADELKKHVKDLCLPNKNLIAPKLSIKSSWINTFKLFYNVEQVSESEYELSFDYEGITVTSTLNVSSFTVKSSTLHVDESLPQPTANREYLIIDEVHQLAERRLTRTRFFERGVMPADEYVSFVLSGTLSNLTTGEWLNYLTFMGLPFKNNALDDRSPQELSNRVERDRSKLKTNIVESVNSIDTNQHRTFDDDAFNKPQMTFSYEKKLTNKNELFHLMYSGKVLPLRNTEDVTLFDELSEGNFHIDFDFSVSDTPNFELFYNLVGSSAITAQSTQVAEELFGEQKQQHNADVINVSSPLNSDDIHLLRVLHQITRDHQVYKSPRIATSINNAILNLNDGLSKKNVYDIISKYAKSNTRFLAYLATLELNILEKLKESNLIKQPELAETEKFKILKDILSKESDETHLIVVNDADSMKTLAAALDIECFTKKQLNDPLNYQDLLDQLFEKQSIVIVPQMMIKSSLDLVQANRLIQYQLNAEISDIIQTQNRINRIGQTRETKAYYIATDVLQKNIIDLFLETYKNIRVAHKGIVELFVDMSSQVNVINDYISKAMSQITEDVTEDVVEDVTEDVIDDVTEDVSEEISEDIVEDVVEDIVEDTTPVIFDENGIGHLFADESATTHDTAEEPRDVPSIWMDFSDRNKQQRSLFSPADKAFMHQMIPTCDAQVG